MSDQLPVQCVSIKNNIDNLNDQLDTLQEELSTASPVDKPRIIKEIVSTESAIEEAESSLNQCIASNRVLYLKLRQWLPFLM